MNDDELERELRKEPAPEPEPVVEERPRARARAKSSGIPAWLLIGAVVVLLGGGVTVLLLGTGASDAFVYSKLVDEVMNEPGRFVGRELRVEGRLRTGSIVFVDEPTCEHTFVLERRGHSMPVRFPRCVVPDTFRDDMPVDVVVEGQLQANGTFEADQVIPRCPSKYEMQQRQENGEIAPHSAPPTRGETS
jgi:cytochrome c-type biogenesis protein CcmE